jgi:hypothetical protein
MRYSQRLGEKLRSSTSMDAYLVPRRRPSSIHDAAQALLNRATVMGNLGCWREALDDIEGGLQRGGAESFQTAETSKLLRSLFGNGWMLEAAFGDWPAFLATAGRLKILPGGQGVLRLLAAGLWDVAKGHAAPLPERLTRLHRAWQLAIR